MFFDHPINPDDEIASFRRLQEGKNDTGSILMILNWGNNKMRAGRYNIGGICSFIGLVRYS